METLEKMVKEINNIKNEIDVAMVSIKKVVNKIVYWIDSDGFIIANVIITGQVYKDNKIIKGKTIKEVPEDAVNIFNSMIKTIIKNKDTLMSTVKLLKDVSNTYVNVVNDIIIKYEKIIKRLTVMHAKTDDCDIRGEYSEDDDTIYLDIVCFANNVELQLSAIKDDDGTFVDIAITMKGVTIIYEIGEDNVEVFINGDASEWDKPNKIFWDLTAKIVNIVDNIDDIEYC